MIALADLLQVEWRAPWWGLVALQPLLVTVLLRLRRQRLLHYADAHLLSWAVNAQAGRNTPGWRRIGHVLFWLLVAGALAGPRLPLPGGNASERQAVPRHDIDLMIVLDVSPSMLARDVEPDRLTRAKLKLHDLVPRLRGERIGLIAFSGDAGLLMPPTRDAALLAHYLQQAKPELFDEAGTQLAAALRLALAHKAQDRALGVLLLTDGEASSLSDAAGNAALAVAREMKAAQVPLHVLAMGTAQGASIPLPEGGVVEENGAPIISRLDAAGFRALAGTAGGSFSTATADDSDLAALYDRGLLTVRATTARQDSTRAWRELYPWLLGPALLLFFLLHAQRRTVAVAALAIASTTANAAELDAWQAYRKQDHLLAQQLYAQQAGYAARMGEGASAYRRKDFGYAVKQFTEALLIARNPQERADALFNLGSSYYLAGNRPAALESFQGVLNYRDDAKARANLAAVTAQIKPGITPPAPGPKRNRGRGPGEGEMSESDTPSSLEAVKEKPQVLQEESGGDGEIARGTPAGQASGSYTAADVRAAQKKLELVRDQPQQLSKRLLTQDRTPTSESAGRPW